MMLFQLSMPPEVIKKEKGKKAEIKKRPEKEQNIDLSREFISSFGKATVVAPMKEGEYKIDGILKWAMGQFEKERGYGDIKDELASKFENELLKRGFTINPVMAEGIASKVADMAEDYQKKGRKLKWATISLTKCYEEKESGQSVGFCELWAGTINSSIGKDLFAPRNFLDFDFQKIGKDEAGLIADYFRSEYMKKNLNETSNNLMGWKGIKINAELAKSLLAPIDWNAPDVAGKLKQVYLDNRAQFESDVWQGMDKKFLANVFNGNAKRADNAMNDIAQMNYWLAARKLAGDNKLLFEQETCTQIGRVNGYLDYINATPGGLTFRAHLTERTLEGIFAPDPDYPFPSASFKVAGIGHFMGDEQYRQNTTESWDFWRVWEDYNARHKNVNTAFFGFNYSLDIPDSVQSLMLSHFQGLSIDLLNTLADAGGGVFRYRVVAAVLTTLFSDNDSYNIQSTPSGKIAFPSPLKDLGEISPFMMVDFNYHRFDENSLLNIGIKTYPASMLRENLIPSGQRTWEHEGEKQTREVIPPNAPATEFSAEYYRKFGNFAIGVSGTMNAIAPLYGISVPDSFTNLAINFTNKFCGNMLGIGDYRAKVLGRFGVENTDGRIFGKEGRPFVQGIFYYGVATPDYSTALSFYADAKFEYNPRTGKFEPRFNAGIKIGPSENSKKCNECEQILKSDFYPPVEQVPDKVKEIAKQHKELNVLYVLDNSESIRYQLKFVRGVYRDGLNKIGDAMPKINGKKMVNDKEKNLPGESGDKDNMEKWGIGQATGKWDNEKDAELDFKKHPNAYHVLMTDLVNDGKNVLRTKDMWNKKDVHGKIIEPGIIETANENNNKVCCLFIDNRTFGINKDGKKIETGKTGKMIESLKRKISNNEDYLKYETGRKAEKLQKEIDEWNDQIYDIEHRVENMQKICEATGGKFVTIKADEVSRQVDKQMVAKVSDQFFDFFIAK